MKPLWDWLQPPAPHFVSRATWRFTSLLAPGSWPTAAVCFLAGLS